MEDFGMEDNRQRSLESLCLSATAYDWPETTVAISENCPQEPFGWDELDNTYGLSAHSGLVPTC